jgi:hypothetical protein
MVVTYLVEPGATPGAPARFHVAHVQDGGAPALAAEAAPALAPAPAAAPAGNGRGAPPPAG